jgi:hypothetical protein
MGFYEDIVVASVASAYNKIEELFSRRLVGNGTVKKARVR